MTCQEILKFLADYLDGNLTPEVQLAFGRHLEICPACQDYLDSYRKTIEMSRIALTSRLAPLPEELVRAILAARSDRDIRTADPAE